MSEDRLLRIANRINLLLLRELGQGVDVQRLLKEPLYARDVLLVCEARPGSDLHSLARHFRAHSADSPESQGTPSNFAPDSSGFAPSRPDSTLADLPQPPASGGWFSRSRWARL